MLYYQRQKARVSGAVPIGGERLVLRALSSLAENATSTTTAVVTAAATATPTTIAAAAATAATTTAATVEALSAGGPSLIPTLAPGDAAAAAQLGLDPAAAALAQDIEPCTILSEDDYLSILVTCSAGIPMKIFVMYFIDRFGRVPMQAGLLLGASISFLCLTASFQGEAGMVSDVTFLFVCSAMASGAYGVVSPEQSEREGAPLSQLTLIIPVPTYLDRFACTRSRCTRRQSGTAPSALAPPSRDGETWRRHSLSKSSTSGGTAAGALRSVRSSRCLARSRP